MSRDLALAVYCIALGWALRAFWESERRSIVWEASDKAANQLRLERPFVPLSPEPLGGEPA